MVETVSSAVEIKGPEPILLVSAYMPCNGMQGCVDEFEDTLDQLSEITAKYSSHQIIIGGDFTEDIIEPNKNSKRLHLLQNFLSENKLSYRPLERPMSTLMVLKLVQLTTFLWR